MESNPEEIEQIKQAENQEEEVEKVEFFVRYQRFEVDKRIFEGTALEAMFSGRHKVAMMYGIP